MNPFNSQGKKSLKPLETLFKALGDKTRLQILSFLAVRPLCNCELHELLGLAPSTVSKHLSLLKAAGWVQDKRMGKWVLYRLSQDSASTYVQELGPLLHLWLGRESSKDVQDRVQQINGKFQCDP